MKKILAIILAAASMSASCQKIENNGTPSNDGTLSFSEFIINCDESVNVRSNSSDTDDYAIFIYNEDGKEVLNGRYGELKAKSGITLTAGNYSLEARSTMEKVPVAEFEKPVYGAKAEFSIEAGKTTAIGNLTCTLLQAKATVAYDDEFLKMVSGNGATTVTVDPAVPLTYPLSYANGTANYDGKAGYFAVNNGTSTTMNIVFSGKIEGKDQKMVANLTGIAPRQWRQIKFIKKIDDKGNAVFTISIKDFADDEELTVPLTVESEQPIGEDPDAPAGDGGISITFHPECTMFTSLDNIIVPDMATPMDLRLMVSIPNGAKKMVVNMESTSQAFLDAVALAGGTTLDLINPAAEQDIVFQIVPFPHGSELEGQTDLIFDLSGAQEPILAFPGEHTFTIKIVDKKGCSNSIPVKLIVNQQ